MTSEIVPLIRLYFVLFHLMTAIKPKFVTPNNVLTSSSPPPGHYQDCYLAMWDDEPHDMRDLVCVSCSRQFVINVSRLSSFVTAVKSGLNLRTHGYFDSLNAVDVFACVCVSHIHIQKEQNSTLNKTINYVLAVFYRAITYKWKLCRHSSKNITECRHTWSGRNIRNKELGCFRP